MSGNGGGRLRRTLHRFAADQAEVESAELLESAAGHGGTPVIRCADRTQVCVAGTLRSVTLRPRAGAPALEAEVYDGSGSVTVVWLGRRRIPGIETGRWIVVRGRVSVAHGRRLIYNPEYELRLGPV